MTTAESHRLARAFITGLSAGDMPDDLLAPEFTAWTITGGSSDRARYGGGVRLLGSLFPGGLTYTADSITAEADRVAIEAHCTGTLESGAAFGNRYIFMLRISAGRIVSVAEHFDPGPVRTILAPLIQARLAQAGGVLPG